MRQNRLSKKFPVSYFETTLFSKFLRGAAFGTIRLPMKKALVETKKAKITNPLDLLKRTLTERCAENPQYSMRAFARDSGSGVCSRKN